MEAHERRAWSSRGRMRKHMRCNHMRMHIHMHRRMRMRWILPEAWRAAEHVELQEAVDRLIRPVDQSVLGKEHVRRGKRRGRQVRSREAHRPQPEARRPPARCRERLVVGNQLGKEVVPCGGARARVRGQRDDQRSGSHTRPDHRHRKGWSCLCSSLDSYQRSPERAMAYAPGINT